MWIEFEEGWNIISKGITKLKRILEGSPETQFSPAEYLEPYTTIYNLCTQDPQSRHNYSVQLYDRYKRVFQDYIYSSVLPSLMEKHNEFLLRELVNRWENHKVMVKRLSHFFEFLDRHYIQKNELPGLNEVGMSYFRNLVFEAVKVKARAAFIALIEQEREGYQVERALLKNIVDLILEIRMEYYGTDFEGAILEDSAGYYSCKASIWISENSCTEFLMKAEECLKKEEDRASHYLHYSTKKKLVETVQKAFNEVLVPVAHAFRDRVTARGKALLQQAEYATRNNADDAAGSQDHVFIQGVIDLHDEFLTYVANCYLNHSLFQKSLKEVLVVFCNKQVSGRSSAELVASFCDNILKKGGKELLRDEGNEATLNKAVMLLGFINDKDLFAEFYQKKLSRRLLFDKNADYDHEMLFLTKLKQQVGGQFTSKMEGMVTDITLARENQNQFMDYLSSNKEASLGIDLTVTVLNSRFWPKYNSSEPILPAEMVKCVEVFKEFYQTKAKHRKLTWIYSLGTCNVNGKFDSKTIELSLVTNQAAALLLFNAADKLSYSEIKTQLNLADKDLVRVLESLSCAKYKILTKIPNAQTITSNDSFEFNSKFNDRMRKIKIPLPPVDERKKVVEDVDKDRRYAIDASIVRIMKSHKVLTHQQLVTNCVEQLGRMFKPDIVAIKKRIEDLIARDFLEREEENGNTYRYLV